MPRRKRSETPEEPATPTYAGEVEWLRCLTQDDDQVSTEEVEQGATDAKHITEACKLVYIMYHNIEARDSLGSLLESLDKSGDASVTKSVLKTAKQQQSLHKSYILNTFFLPHVKELKRMWEVSHPYASFAAIEHRDRTKLWLEAYDRNPKSMVINMLKPIVKVLDLHSIFREDLTGADGDKMKAMRGFLRRKYWFGCNSTYKYTIALNQKPKTLDEWARFASICKNGSGMIPIADVPLSPSFLTLAPSPKKAKKIVGSEDDLESLLPGLKDANPGSSPLESTTSSQAGEDRDVPGKSNSISNSISVSRRMSVLGTTPAPEKPKFGTERPAGRHSPYGLPSTPARSSTPSQQPSPLEHILVSRGLDRPASPPLSEADSSAAGKEWEIDDDLVL